ncbi:MAG: hypothetical protein JO211_06530 [Acidobacteriaceae bacterium]|nr:hypothetical protein [Acidobacteriaceae bacterium]
MVFKSLPVAMVLLFAGGSYASRPGGFRVIGPGGGGAQYNPTISPHDPNTVLVSCDMTGAYITHDAGRSWRMFNLRGTVNFFVFDPNEPRTIYADATALWRSRDNGESWALVYPRPQSVRGVRMASDHADETILADPDPLGRITALAIDPRDSKVLYVSASKGAEAALFISRDAGETWERETQLPEPAISLCIDNASPSGEETIVAASRHQVTWKTGSAVRSRQAPAGVAFTSVSAGFDTGGAMTLYAASDQGAFVLCGEGSAWQKCGLRGEGAEVRAVATSLRNPNIAYLSFQSLKISGDTWDGVAKTEDAGRTWQLCWKESRKPADNVRDAWITDRFGPGWGENPLMLGVAANDAALCYATDLGRTLKTNDGGAHWEAVYSREATKGAWTSTGLDVTTSYGIHFDPFDHARQFITYTDIGLFRSEDGAKSWLSSTAGVPEEWLNTTYWIVFDPAVRGRMWSVNSATHDLPRPKMWRHRSVSDFKGGVCRSDDGGRTWTKSNAGMEETAATHILLDERSPVTARRLYVAAFGRGVYKSTDGGRSWSLKNNGIAQKEPFAWRLMQTADRTLYVLIARRSENGSIGNDGDGAIYRSTDAAESWTRVPMPEEANAPNGLASDPRSPRRLYLATWARATGMHGEGGGVFVSDDAGETWQHTLTEDQHVYDVTVDPRDPNILYAAGFESSAWRSMDRGAHWTRIPGFNFKWGHRVIADPADPSSVYITTFGGSVWHGEVNGPNRPVDIVSPVLEPGHIQ